MNFSCLWIITGGVVGWFVFLLNWVLGFNETKLNFQSCLLVLSTRREEEDSGLSQYCGIWLQFPTLQQAVLAMLGKTLGFTSSKSLKGLIYIVFYWMLPKRHVQIMPFLRCPSAKGLWTTSTISTVGNKDGGEELTREYVVKAVKTYTGCNVLKLLRQCWSPSCHIR